LDQGFFDPWFVYPMNRIIFQSDGTPMVPIFHFSIIPIVSEANSVHILGGQQDYVLDHLLISQSSVIQIDG
jgi:hypothetical protein